jgi:hypothetical protein
LQRFAWPARSLLLTEELVRGVSDYTVAISEDIFPEGAAPLKDPCGSIKKTGYRLLWPREAFLTFALFSPRAPVRGPFGAAFLRAARFTFLRSSLSVMLLVFAMYLANLSIGANLQNFRGAPAGQTSPPASSRHAVEIVL